MISTGSVINVSIADLQYKPKTTIPTASTHVFHLNLAHLGTALEEMLQYVFLFVVFFYRDESLNSTFDKLFHTISSHIGLRPNLLRKGAIVDVVSQTAFLLLN